jgi:hypothetical protein
MTNALRLKKANNLARAVACDAEYDENSVRRVLQQLDEFQQALTDSELAAAGATPRKEQFGRV